MTGKIQIFYILLSFHNLNIHLIRQTTLGVIMFARVTLLSKHILRNAMCTVETLMKVRHMKDLKTGSYAHRMYPKEGT